MVAKNPDDSDASVSRIAGAIAEPARTRMLYCLMDGHARTSTELAAVADVTASTASVHLARLKEQQLVKVVSQGRHRYYSLGGPRVAAALEALNVIASGSRRPFSPTAPNPLRAARTCYDHMAGAVAVSIHDHLVKRRWVSPSASAPGAYELTHAGASSLQRLGIDIEETQRQRRRFAYACLDWSERRPHLGGALGAALLKVALQKKWIDRHLDSRALNLTRSGRRAMHDLFGLKDASATPLGSAASRSNCPAAED